MTIQLRICRAQHDEPRLGRGLPVQEPHKTQATLQRLVPHDGGIQGQMRLIFSWGESLETAQGLEVDLPSLLAPGPTSLRVRSGVEKHAVGVAPQFGNRRQIEADNFINIFLLRLVAVHAMRGDARRQAMPRLVQVLRVEVDPRVVRLGLRGWLSRRRLRDGERQSAPACDSHHRERGNLQATFGTTRTAVEDVTETERLLATRRDEGGLMR